MAMITNDEKKINTIYIISKGRPQCVTAQTLTRIKYPGKWYIVVGNNDLELESYKKRWGDRIIVFDWYKEVKNTDLMDNFGYDKKASGASPVRNAARKISKENGELRHWQFDDDYLDFSRYNPYLNKNETIKDGRILFSSMYRIADFANDAKLNNIGFALATIEGNPQRRHKWGPRVYNAHNLPSDDDLFVEWKGRMNDDTINAVNVWRTGGVEMMVKFLQLRMEPTQKSEGGLTDLYKEDGTVRKTAYLLLACPAFSKLVIRFGRFHHNVNWRGKLVPKIISDKWEKQ